MSLPDRLARALARLCFCSAGETPLTRKQCAASGAFVFSFYALVMLVCFVVARIPGASFSLRPGSLKNALIQAGHAPIRVFAAAVPVLAVLGAIAGLHRYQSRKGTEEERAGGGYRFQEWMSALLLWTYLPVLLVDLMLTFLERLLGHTEANGGEPGRIAIIAALFASASFAFASLWTRGSVYRELEMMLPVLIYFSACDSLLTWMVFKWDQLGWLAEPRERGVPQRFSLQSLLLTVVGYGTYLALLSWLFDWAPDP